MTSTASPTRSRTTSKPKRGRALARRVIVPLMAVPLAKAGARGARYTMAAAKATRRGEPLFPGVPAPAATVGLAARVALDELFLMPSGPYASTVSGSDYEVSSAELDEAVRYYENQGWLDDPTGYFEAPGTATEVETTQVIHRRGQVTVARFESQWMPRPGEPGAERWLSFEKNRTAYATVLRHDDRPRPWLVCLHGQNMGTLGDLEAMHLLHLHRNLGVNLVFPTLPLHARRRAGLRPGAQFVSQAYPVNNVLGLGQSVWDVRRLLRWLREEQAATTVGLYGFSLGSYVTSLVAGLDDELACVIAVVPSGDLAAPLKATEPLLPARRRQHRALHDWRASLVQGVVSPLARPCVVPHERRFVIAGQGDRLATAQGAVTLWRHWDEPSIDWFPCGHLTMTRAAGFEARIEEIVRSCGVVAG